MFNAFEYDINLSDGAWWNKVFDVMWKNLYVQWNDEENEDLK